MSKSMVLPNPWQRGQAPNGLLKEKKPRLRFFVADLAAAALEATGEAQLTRFLAVAGHRLEDGFASLTISWSRVRHDAGARIGRDHDAIDKAKRGLEKSISSSDSGVENS